MKRYMEVLIVLVLALTPLGTAQAAPPKEKPATEKPTTTKPAEHNGGGVGSRAMTASVKGEGGGNGGGVGKEQ